MMRGMAVNAAYVVLQMFRAQEVCVLLAELMAAQTALARLLARECLEADDLRNIAAGFSVRFARSVTRLATLILHATMIQRRLPVWTVVVALGDVVVAPTARIGARIERCIARIIDQLLLRRL